MTILHRAATIAVMSLTLTGLLGASARTQAQIAQTSPIATAQPAVLSTINAPDPVEVPTSAPVTDPVIVERTAPAVSEPVQSFTSLDHAVAAHNGSDADEATRCLAGAIYFESKGEPLAGQLAVAEVILNRSQSGRFPRDVCGVVTQRGQFSFVRGGRIPSIDEGRAAYRVALSVARVALAKAWNSPARKALYFNTPDRRPAARLVKVAALGNHIFYR